LKQTFYLQGVTESQFMPDDAFREFVKMEVAKLLNPSINCAKRVHEKLIEAIDQSDVEVSLELRVQVYFQILGHFCALSVDQKFYLLDDQRLAGQSIESGQHAY
jgi:hypothetical protein